LWSCTAESLNKSASALLHAILASLEGKQEAINGSAIDAIKSVPTIETITDVVDSNIQNWIKYNISDKRFIDTVINRIYIDEETSVTYGLKDESTIKVVNLSQEINKEAVYKFSDVWVEDNVIYDSFNIKSIVIRFLNGFG